MCVDKTVASAGGRSKTEPVYLKILRETPSATASALLYLLNLFSRVRTRMQGVVEAGKEKIRLFD